MVVVDEISRAAREKEAWAALSSVMDPEIPVISVVDLGIVNSVDVEGDRATVSITPTYIACIASNIMQADMEEALRRTGFENVRVDLRKAPPWTSDRMTKAGREKLQAYGIAPPAPRTDPSQTPACPVCDSNKTVLVSAFGSSACKSLYKCEECGEPFERFKCK